MEYETDDRVAAAVRYNALDSSTRRKIEAAADDLLKRADWSVWSQLTSSRARCLRLRDARYAAFLDWERSRT